MANNMTENTTTIDTLTVVKVTCLGAISLIGIIGNILIFATVMSHKRKSSECFILNLAITDLMVCAFGIPLDIYQLLHGNIWTYGAVLCKIVWPSQTLLVLVSIMTLTAMSLERYRAIITPLKPKLKKPDIMKVIFFIWLLGVAVVSPYINALTYSNQSCSEHWPRKKDAKYYTLVLFIVDYCVPLTIITYCYARVGLKLYKSNLLFNGESKEEQSSTIQRDAQRSRLQRNTRIIKIFTFAVVMFLVCMLPGDIYWMWVDWGRGKFPYQQHYQTFADILVYANSAINPFIFGSCNMTCVQALCLRKKQANSSYSLRFSFTSSYRRRNRGGSSSNHWRRVARRVKNKQHKTMIIWETNV